MLEPYQQIQLFDIIQNSVKFTDMCEFKDGQLKEYTAKVSYSEVVLLISMIHEYIEMLEASENILINHYVNKFEDIARNLEQAIGYNYNEKLKKCLQKGSKKDKDNGLSENRIGA